MPDAEASRSMRAACKLTGTPQERRAETRRVMDLLRKTANEPTHEASRATSEPAMDIDMLEAGKTEKQVVTRRETEHTREAAKRFKTEQPDTTAEPPTQPDAATTKQEETPVGEDTEQDAALPEPTQLCPFKSAETFQELRGGASPQAAGEPTTGDLSQRRRPRPELKPGEPSTRHFRYSRAPTYRPRATGCGRGDGTPTNDRTTGEATPRPYSAWRLTCPPWPTPWPQPHQTTTLLR